MLYALDNGKMLWLGWDLGNDVDRKGWREQIKERAKKEHAPGGVKGGVPDTYSLPNARTGSIIARVTDSDSWEESMYSRLRTETTRPGRYPKDMKSWLQGVLTEVIKVGTYSVPR